MYSIYDTGYNMGFAEFAKRQRGTLAGQDTAEPNIFTKLRTRLGLGGGAFTPAGEVVPYEPGGKLVSSPGGKLAKSKPNPGGGLAKRGGKPTPKSNRTSAPKPSAKYVPSEAGGALVPYEGGGALVKRASVEDYMNRKPGNLGEALRRGVWKNKGKLAVAGAGLAAAGAGAYGYGKYRKARSDKNKKRGPYNRLKDMFRRDG